MHLELSTTSQYVGGATPSRSFAMIATADPTTVVDIFAADSAGVGGAANGVLIKELTVKTPKVEMTDSSTFVYYVLKQGALPSAIWMDAPDTIPAGSAAPAWSVPGIVSTSFTASPGELVLVSASAASVVIMLPSAVGLTGQRVGIKDTGSASSFPITVSSAGGTMDNASFQYISTSYGSLTFVSDGANWWIVPGG